MATIKSLEDLKRLKEEALEKCKAKATAGRAQVIVGLGSCSIAVGAHQTRQAILDAIQTGNLDGIVVTQTGCIGRCAWEPIVEVVTGSQPKVIYGKVTPAKAQRIMQEHVVGGKVVSEYVVPA